MVYQYTLGDPIKNYNYVKSIRKFTLNVKATSKLNGKSSSSSKTITIDTIPPSKPIAKNISHGKIINIDSTFVLDIINKEPGVVYTASLNNSIINIGDPLLKNISSVNGIYRLIITARKQSNNMYNSSYYYIDVNNYSSGIIDHDNNVTENYNLPVDLDRNVLIPFSRENDLFRFPGELIIDEHTGNISVVSNTKNSDTGSYEIIEITKELNNLLSLNSTVIYDIFKVTNLYKNQLSWLRDNLSEIDSNNDLLKPFVDAVVGGINNLKTQVDALKAEVDKTTSDITDIRNKITSITNNVDGSFLTNYNKLMNLSTNITKLRNDLLDYADLYTTVIDNLGRNYYNLRSVEIEANKKILTTKYNAFKDKHEGFYTKLVNIITSF
ncbi:hypothetical protein FPHOBKDP_00212 [Listeria phage LPJP1]|nr:hypothetical protein FPHOBKDP_00212 [Listeria phage LPJP1]